jgi:hypothetical protein
MKDAKKCLPKTDVESKGAKKLPTKPADIKPKNPTFKTGKSG